MNRRNVLHALSTMTAAGMLPLYAHGDSTTSSKNSPMLTRKIPSSGEALPVIGLGTWQTFDVGTGQRAPLEEVMREFVQLGGSVIDSSPMYGKSEEVAGEIIARLNLRQKLFVATKVWTSGKSAGVAQMDASMKKLGANPIDLMQAHNLLDVEAHLETLNAWKREGRTRYIGVTHYTASAYDAVAKVIAKYKVDFLQINYSVAEREAEQRVLPLARERGIAVIINRPFAGGELLRRLRTTAVPAWAADIGCTSWAQLLLKFVISHPATTCAIPATSRIEHLRDNMAAGVGVMQDEKVRARIAAAVA